MLQHELCNTDFAKSNLQYYICKTKSSSFEYDKLLGGYWGVEIGNVFLKTNRVGFGRTELSLRLSCTEFCALSSGHGPRGLGFQDGGEGVDFHVLLGVKSSQNKKKKTSQRKKALTIE